MKRIILLSIISFIIFSSCSSSGYYQRELSPENTGIDFSNGKWLLGNIDVDYEIKDKLTEMIVKDFSKHLNGRFANALNDKSLLIARQTPVNPSKSLIEELKKGTNYDYFINVKCTNEKSNDLHSLKGEYVDRFTVDNYYYGSKVNNAIVQLEIYDLNRGLIIYSQKVRGSLGSGLTTSKAEKKLFIGCYKKIMKHINKAS
ncbi:hypothetical protein [Flavobacterium sp. 5]|uniref:hypothetical protein n=1 Tax=Flavobacterium sp. 5 TaxID=2035199 RepID=UPI000C2B6983|nr:hypothetical protein [Flavobacterium sp. 5]PKB15245.1 hypothetical protein CLU82_0309 [Flavobacterium sp. 5]